MEYIRRMEKAILKTLAYYDIFGFPLKAWEVHKWLFGKEASLKQVEKSLKTLIKKSKIKNKRDYFYLSNKKVLIQRRLVREKISQQHLRKAIYISQLYRVIPGVKLIGVSGSLAMMGSGKQDDIDLFVITEKNRIWLSRLLLILLTTITGFRRKRREKLLSAAGKICINLILENDNLAQNKKNIYLAHEVLQMRVLWQREEVYSKFLHDNEWVFKYLPNWKSGIKQIQNFPRGSGLAKFKSQKYNSKVKNNGFVDWLEELAKKIQLKIMENPSGQERIENGALYFHPEDKGKKILEEYNRQLKKLLFS